MHCHFSASKACRSVLHRMAFCFIFCHKLSLYFCTELLCNDTSGTDNVAVFYVCFLPRLCVSTLAVLSFLVFSDNT